MIGQKNLCRQISKQLSENEFPNFAVLCGNGEFDKLELIQHIASKLTCSYTIIHSPKVDEVRQVITEAYTQRAPIVYALVNFDNVSAQTKNALLKVTEEPPSSAYIIIGVKNRDNLLKTLRSRATIYQMDRYTGDEISAYSARYNLTSDQMELVLNLCETPDEVDLLLNYNVDEFYSYLNLVVDNIAKVSGANSFKIADKLKLKDNDVEKYDLALFLKCFAVVCVERYSEDKDKRYIESVQLTSRALDNINVASLNKQMIVDDWILGIRGVWLK